MKKLLNEQGQKAYQRKDREDRSLKYRSWLRQQKTNGYYIDVDLIKWRKVGEDLKPVAITEITRCDKEDISQHYLDAIIDRWFRRDRQAYFTQKISDMLSVPAFIVCYQRDMLWLWVYNFCERQWTKFSPISWAEYLSKL